MRTVLLEGWDWLNVSITFNNAWPNITLGRNHLEWSGGGLRVAMQYTGNMTALMWVPQHFISAGLCAMLLVQLRQQPLFLAISGILVASCLLWSPFVAIGLLPLVAVLLIDNGIKPFLRWQNFFLAIPLAGLLALYLTSGSSNIPSGYLWERYEWGVLARWLPVFYFTEFLGLVCLLYFLRPQLCRERFFIASVVTLLIVPAYTFGWFNDWCMRTSFPALFVLCWYTAHVVLNHRPETTAEMWIDEHCGGELQSRLRYVCTRLVVAVLGIGAVTALFEMNRANNHAGTFSYEHLFPSALTELSQGLRNYRVVYDLPDLLRWLLRAMTTRGKKRKKGNSSSVPTTMYILTKKKN